MSNTMKQMPIDGQVSRYHLPAAINPLIDHEAKVPSSDDTAASRTGLPLAPLGELLDTIDQGIVLLRSDSHPCYSNSAAERLLGSDAERGVLARGIRSVSLAAMRRSDRRSAEVDVETPTGSYRMRATLLLQKIKEIKSRAVLVTIERAQSGVPSRETLIRRFGMTGREADVALLLADGKRNAVIASELHISTHTARHHTESVLSKLNVHTRGEVAKAIVRGGESEGTTER